MLVIQKSGSTLLPYLHTAVEMCVAGLPACNLQVRFRKPRRLGRAPSKDQSYFKKYYPTQKDLDKALPLYNNYNILLKSIVAAFQEELVLKESQTVVERSKWNEKAHHEKCMKYNDAENERMRSIRLQRIEEIKKEAAVHQAAEAQSEVGKKYQDEVLRAIEEAEDWITLENVEEKITEAVDNPVNFNFGINLTGIITRRTALVLPPDHEVYQIKEAENV